MTLQTVDKVTYRKNLNKVIVCAVVALFIIALSVSTILIQLIGNPNGSNFIFNLIGVGVAAGAVGAVIYRIRTLPFMHEVLYVWRLKQELNAIHRKSAKLKAALELNSRNALIVSYFNFLGSIQLYELDDNDLTLDSLRKELLEFEEKLKSLNVEISVDDYHRGLLKQLTTSDS